MKTEHLGNNKLYGKSIADSTQTPDADIWDVYGKANGVGGHFSKQAKEWGQNIGELAIGEAVALVVAPFTAGVSEVVFNGALMATKIRWMQKVGEFGRDAYLAEKAGTQ